MWQADVLIALIKMNDSMWIRDFYGPAGTAVSCKPPNVEAWVR